MIDVEQFKRKYDVQQMVYTTMSLLVEQGSLQQESAIGLWTVVRVANQCGKMLDVLTNS